MPRNLFIVIVGCGRLGSLLANELSRIGHWVVVVDLREGAFAGLTTNFSGFRVTGDATRLAVLREASIAKADVLFATTLDDNVNLMVAQIAQKIFGVHHVLARVYDPRREAVFTRLGIDTICPTSVAAELFRLAVASGPEEAVGAAR